jgi:hypothetical protein
MDHDRFDSLVKSVTQGTTRRSVLGVGSALGYVLGLNPSREASAKKRKKKKCKSCGPCQHCQKGKCTPQPDGTDCGSGKRCQRGACVCPEACCSNGDCGFQGACLDGVCLCLSGARFCQDTCIPEERCCSDRDCFAGTGRCQNGTCACPDGRRVCQGACVAGDCCDDGDCHPGEICAQHQCVVWQGTCPTGSDVCVSPTNPSSHCGAGNADCACFTTMANQTRCGGTMLSCGMCNSDADCAVQFPDVPGVFCVKDTGTAERCYCPRACRVPCPG